VTGTPGRRRELAGEALQRVGEQSARPQSAASQQQQPIERRGRDERRGQRDNGVVTGQRLEVPADAGLGAGAHPGRPQQLRRLTRALHLGPGQAAQPQGAVNQHQRSAQLAGLGHVELQQPDPLCRQPAMVLWLAQKRERVGW
jgi:hypothetical protein